MNSSNEKTGTLNSTIFFSDMKEFTSKTSLLTRDQINRLLDKQDEIVLPVFEEYEGELVKTIGDGYMVLFSSPTNAVLAAKKIHMQIAEYNKGVQNSLEKLEFRIAINVGEVNKKVSQSGVDYFGEPVNLAARLMDKTPANCVYISEGVYYTMNKNEVQAVSVGEMNFKGVPESINVYNVLTDEKLIRQFKEGRLKDVEDSKNVTKQVSEESESIDYGKIKEVDKVVFNYSAMSAVVAFQPLPFADYFIFTPIHIYMIIRIGELYGMKLSFDVAKAILLQLLSVLGYEYLSKQVMVGLSKIGLPFIGGYIVLPLTFSLTYGLGKVVNIYFFYKSRNIEVSKEHMKKVFHDKRGVGLDIAKKNKDLIKKIGKRFKENTYGYLKAVREGKNNFTGEVYNKIKKFETDDFEVQKKMSSFVKFFKKEKFSSKEDQEGKEETDGENT